MANDSDYLCGYRGVPSDLVSVRISDTVGGSYGVGMIWALVAAVVLLSIAVVALWNRQERYITVIKTHDAHLDALNRLNKALSRRIDQVRERQSWQ
jgi:uncharacterized membrane protein